MFNSVSKYLFMTYYIHLAYAVLMYPKLTVQTQELCGSSVFIIEFEHIQKSIQPI